MNRMLEYVHNWLELIRRDRSRLPNDVATALRSYGVWRRSLKDGNGALADAVPWVTFRARAFLEEILTPAANVFEYGAGGSTIFYARRARWVVSVEHDEAWFKRVRSILAAEGIQNSQCVFVPPEPVDYPATDPGDPHAYRSGGEVYKRLSFYKYASAIDAFPDQSFDLVAVDGRARPSCVYHARPKVKRGGYLMLDNSERPYYQRAEGLLSDWEAHIFSGPGPYNAYFWETTAWRRPWGDS